MAMKKWSHEKVIKLIEAYEVNPILWDIRNPDYKNRIKKSEVLEKLAADFKCAGSEISRKLHNLRNQVSQEIKKMKNKKSGSGVEDNKIWPYFSALAFIVPSLQAAGTQSNLMPTSSNCIDEEENSEGIELTPTEEVNCPPSNKKTKRKAQLEDTDSAIKKAALEVLAKCPDEYEKFGAYVADELRSLKFENVRRRLKTEIRKSILSAVQEEDAYFMQISSPSTSFDPTPPNATPSENSCSSAKDLVESYDYNVLEL